MPALVLLTSLALAAAAAPRSPITNNAEWQNGRPVALPKVTRPKVESVFLYRPETNWTYSHHPSITFFTDRFFAIWSNGRKDENAPGQPGAAGRPIPLNCAGSVPRQLGPPREGLQCGRHVCQHPQPGCRRLCDTPLGI